MKTLLLSIIVFCFPLIMIGQIRLFTNNATNSDTLESIVFKEFSKKYDFLI